MLPAISANATVITCRFGNRSAPQANRNRPAAPAVNIAINVHPNTASNRACSLNPASRKISFKCWLTPPIPAIEIVLPSSNNQNGRSHRNTGSPSTSSAVCTRTSGSPNNATGTANNITAPIANNAPRNPSAPVTGRANSATDTAPNALIPKNATANARPRRNPKTSESRI